MTPPLKTNRWLVRTAAVFLVAIATGPASGAGRCGGHPWCDTSLPPDERAGLLLAELTLEEKISLLAGDDLFGVAGREGTHTGTSDGIARLDLPTLHYSDGPMGVRSGQATAMPAPIGLAATWDSATARRYGALVANEARNKGNDVVFAPTVNIMRTPLGGRTFEGYGEDPFLVSRIGVAWVRGAQEDEGIIANVKHFAANNQEGVGPQPPPGAPLGVALLGNRFIVNAVVDERTLREIYLPAFEAAVKEAGVGSVMCAYNRLNGQYACENEHLLDRILKGDPEQGGWGFEGYVLSDYGAAHPHGTAASLANGLDFEPWPGMAYSPLQVTLAVTASLASTADVDEHVRRILRTLFVFGVFDRDAHPENGEIDESGHLAAAGEIEEAAITLLKNEGALPLNDGALQSIAVIGADAARFQSRAGSAGINPFMYTTPLDEIRARVGSEKVRYDPGDDHASAADAATGADVALVFVADTSIEGVDRPCLSLNCPGDLRDQEGMIRAVAAANANTVVVLETGAPVLTPWRGDPRIRAILEAWVPGADAGTAITRVLFGDVDPGGRLPVTFPNSEADLPTAGHPERYPGILENAYYDEGVFVGYRWFDAGQIEPAYPFGFGLSYTTFEYADLVIVALENGDVEVRFSIANTGSRRGSDVAQVYVAPPDPSAPVPRPPRELKGFAKVDLPPGASESVTIVLDERAFAHWGAGNEWVVTPGCHGIIVGRSSRDAELQGTVPRGDALCAGG